MAEEANFENMIFYLLGPPGVGKLTVGQHLAGMTGARLVHNHLWLNPIFSLIEQDGVIPLPKDVWTPVSQVRRAVFETLRTLTPISWNLIFTHAAVGEKNDADMEVANDIIGVAESRGAQLIIVQMTCAAEVLAERVAMPERRLLFKENDVDAARLNALREPFHPGHPDTIAIDTTNLSAKATAHRILLLAEKRR